MPQQGVVKHDCTTPVSFQHLERAPIIVLMERSKRSQPSCSSIYIGPVKPPSMTIDRFLSALCPDLLLTWLQDDEEHINLVHSRIVAVTPINVMGF